jgi:TonB family protein
MRNRISPISILVVLAATLALTGGCGAAAVSNNAGVGPEGLQGQHTWTRTGGGAEGGVPGAVQPPVVDKLRLSGELPAYLPAARMAGVQGLVIVKVCLTDGGEVDAARTRVLRGLPGLDDEVLSRVRTWRYRPHLVDGTPTPVCFPARFIFRLPG